MMKFVLVHLLLIFHVSGFGQRRDINTEKQAGIVDSFVINNCEQILNPQISPRGNYFSYNVNNLSVLKHETIFGGTGNSWRVAISEARSIFYSSNDSVAFYEKGDSLYMLSLQSGISDKIGKTKSYKGVNGPSMTWCAYLSDDKDRTLSCFDVSGKSKFKFKNVSDYWFDQGGNILVVKCAEIWQGAQRVKLVLVDLAIGVQRTLYEHECPVSYGYSIFNVTIEKSGRGVVFVESEKLGEIKQWSVRVYNSDNGLSVRILSRDSLPEQSVEIEGAEINPIWSADGRFIFLRFKDSKTASIPGSNAVSVDVWNYRDNIIQSQQLNDFSGNYPSSVRRYTFLYDILGRRWLRLEGAEDVIKTTPKEMQGDNVILSDNYYFKPYEDIARHLDKTSWYLLSVVSKQRFKFASGHILDVQFSPDGKNIVYFLGKDYYCFNLASKKTTIISKEINVRLDQEWADDVPDHAGPAGIAGWSSDNERVFVYDSYDIWSLNLDGKTKPSNVTQGIDRRNSTKFTIIDFSNSTFGSSDTLLLSAFNVKDKRNGFYELCLIDNRVPTELLMSPAMYFQVRGNSDEAIGMMPLRAEISKAFLVQKETSAEPASLYFTRDFKELRLLATPKVPFYNAPRGNLIEWRSPRGKSMQGIIYKPTNFDPKAKYPVIVKYYELRSHELFQFQKPAFSTTEINTAWFVSRGYLVFVPDIHFSWAAQTGKTNGDNLCEAVLSGIKKLTSFPWVDRANIGINGHSFGGFETNYLVTHTNYFKAAAESSGSSDAISSYLSLTGPLGKPGDSRIFFAESAQGRMGVDLWERKDLYIKNTCVLNADKVTTPLLIMHNMKDPSVPWGQGIEMFLALQRLGKKVWLLQYDNGRHSVSGRDAIDYTIRINQYFDHWLKGLPAPVWMTRGVPAKLKGIETGLEYDGEMRTPPAVR